MSRLTYGLIELQLLRLNNVSIEPVYSDDGVDIVYHKYRIEAQCLLNPEGTRIPEVPVATLARFRNTNARAPGPLALNPMRAGQSLKVIRDQLLVPRKPLRIHLGNDLWLESPANPPPGAADQTADKSDVNNGPKPLYCHIPEVHGTKSVPVIYGIETWLSSCAKAVVSNRWQQQSSTDEMGYTTLHTQGVAVIRSDYFYRTGILLDSFRRILLPAAPAEFKREQVQVTQSSDGTHLYYNVIDRQTPLGWKNLGGAMRVQGDAVWGWQREIKDLKGGINRVEQGVNQLVNLDLGGFFLGGIKSSIPEPRLSAVARCWGSPESRREGLMDLAIGVCMERLASKANETPAPVSMYVTTSAEDLFVECRMEAYPPLAVNLALVDPVFLPGPLQALAIAAGAGKNADGVSWFKDQANMADEYPNLGVSRLSTRSRLPRSSNSRGSWAGRLLTQALIESYCVSPTNAPTAAVDTPISTLDEFV